MEKCTDINQRRRTLLNYRRVRGNPAAQQKQIQLDSSVNCVQGLEPIKPTVFKVAIKNKYDIRATDQSPSLKQPPDSSQLNLGKVTAWGNASSMSASLKRQCTLTTEPQRYPSRSTNPKGKTPVQNKMFYITGEGNRRTKYDAEDQVSRKEVVMETPCETAASSVTFDSEFQGTEVNIRETLHFYLPIHDIQDEEEFTTIGEPPADVSQDPVITNGVLKREQNCKNTKTKQDDKNGNRVKDSAWASAHGIGLQDQMQRRLTRARKSVPVPVVTVYSIEENEYSEISEHPWNRLSQTQPLKHNYVNRPVVDLTIYDLETELDEDHSFQANTHVNNSQSNANENLSLTSCAKNDKEKSKTVGSSTWKPQRYVVIDQTNFLARPQNIQHKPCISSVQMVQNKLSHTKQ
ncbi:uncharacterized protein LOC122564660 [Chiloscyllium plagiosum]|uniref:uncharacterized protein LOC122564660 n=1 Tax=Chiloscyllium plagiosum TaxID=36176 RepID=UPI001CB7DC8C|nr:uncharacterized protein LOC122564660 [Chiloscyllium plagiosum]